VHGVLYGREGKYVFPAPNLTEIIDKKEYAFSSVASKDNAAEALTTKGWHSNRNIVQTEHDTLLVTSAAVCRRFVMAVCSEKELGYLPTR